MAHIYGQLEKAQLEILAAPPAGAPIGYIYYDSTLNAAQVLTPSGWVDATQPGTALLVSGGTVNGNLSVNGSTNLGTLNVGGLASLSGGFNSTVNSTFSSGVGIVTAGGLIAGSLIGVKSFAGVNNSATQTTGTYTPTDGTRMIVVEIVGGGGAGANAAITSSSALATNDFVRAGGAGGGGAYLRALIRNIRPGGILATMTYQAGYAGQKSTSSNGGGNAGGHSEFVFGSVILRALGGAGGVQSSTGDKLYRIGGGGSGGQTFTSGSSPDVVIIDAVAGAPGGDTLAYYDQQFSQLDFIGMIQRGEGGTPANCSATPLQMNMSYGTGTISVGDSSASNRSYGIGGPGSAVVMMVASASGGLGGAGRVVIYEYA